jgi:PAS domain S-box-containing protein
VGALGGLNLLNSDGKTFTRITEEQGFISNSIFSILEDTSGYLWIGTSAGLIQYSHDKKEVVNFTVSDGLQSNEFSIRNDGAVAGKDGLFYFAGKNGLTLFNPLQIERNRKSPPVILTSFRIFNEEISMDQKPFSLENLNLTWKDSMITFEFAALDFTAPEQNQYAYMMEGFDRDWIPSGKGRTATYTNLDGGQYIFRVKASNNHGVWNEKGITLPVKIKAPWWKTLLFKAFIFCIFMGFVLLVVFYVKKLSTEITEHRKSDKELKKVQNYLSDIINSMPSMMVGINKDREVTMWNSTAEKSFGITIDEAFGRSITDVLPLLIDEEKTLIESLQTRQLKEIKKKSFKTDDSSVFQNITIYPLSGEDETGAVIRIDDVTAQVRIEEMMIQSEKMLSIGGLAAGMAHEINNPLAGIIQISNVLKNRLYRGLNNKANLLAAEKAGISMDQISEFMELREIPTMIQKINESGERVTKIIENMLSFSRKSNEMRSTYDVSQIMDKAIELAESDYNLKKKFDFRQIKIIRQYGENLKPIVCDISKILQVLLNILRNGTESMQMANTENARFTIKLSEERTLNMISIQIMDNGPGMSEETRKRVFEPFFTTKPVGIGTGLGMSVSYFIIKENHQGEMTVESVPGKGTIFTILLPYGYEI